MFQQASILTYCLLTYRRNRGPDSETTFVFLFGFPQAQGHWIDPIELICGISESILCYLLEKWIFPIGLKFDHQGFKSLSSAGITTFKNPLLKW